MNLVKALIISSLLLTNIIPPALATLPAGNDCDQIKIELKLTPSSDQQSNGKIELSFETDPSDYSAYLFSGKDNNNQLEIKDKHIDNLAAGSYHLYVKIGKSCVKHFTVEIK